MFDKLTNEELSTAIEQMVAAVGLKPDESVSDLVKLLTNGDTLDCIQKIATRLGLPVIIDLAHVSDATSAASSFFESRELTRTDESGHGVDWITAQVRVPKFMPMFGSKDLEGYHIDVRVGKDCSKHPESFIAVMAHELSHVLLAALWHPMRDSELHTDLVPLLMGFRHCVLTGRKRVEMRDAGNGARTETTTFGYLDDSQFEFAYHRVGELQKGYEDQRLKLLRAIAALENKVIAAQQSLNRFKAHLAYLDSNLTHKIKKDDGMRIVSFHQWEYTKQSELKIAELESRVSTARRFAEGVRLYTGSTLDSLCAAQADIDVASGAFEPILRQISEDTEVLRRNVGLLAGFRIDRRLQPRQ